MIVSGGRDRSRSNQRSILVVLHVVLGVSEVLMLFHVPVLGIIEHAFFLGEERRADEETGNDTTEEGDEEGDQGGSDLDASLTGGGAVLTRIDALESGFRGVRGGHCRVNETDALTIGEGSSHRGRASTTDCSHKTGHAVEVMDAAGVVDTDLLEERGHVDVTEDRKSASDHADEHGTPGLNEEIGGGTDSDTTSKGGVLDVNHVELTLAAKEDGAAVSHNTRTRQRNNSVDDDAVLLVASGEGAVEGGPEHPEEDGTDHGEEVGLLVGEVVGFLLFDGLGDAFRRSILVEPGETPRSTETEVSTESVDENGTAHIDGLEIDSTNGEVETVEGAANEGDPKKLGGSDLAEESTESDHHRTGVEISIDHLGDGETDLVPVVTGDDDVPEGGVEEGPLENHSRDEEVEADGGEGVLGGEGHEETEADEDHDVNVLIHGIETIHILLLSLESLVVEVVVDEDTVEDQEDALPNQDSGHKEGRSPSHFLLKRLFGVVLLILSIFKRKS